MDFFIFVPNSFFSMSSERDKALKILVERLMKMSYWMMQDSLSGNIDVLNNDFWGKFIFM